jgi:hypothetical protein
MVRHRYHEYGLSHCCCTDFPTEALGLRLKATGCIEYEGGDVSAGPVHTGKTKGYIGHRRQKGDSDSDSGSDDSNY